MHDNPSFIPSHYHIFDRPITYNELTSLIKTIKRELPNQTPEPPNEFDPSAPAPDDLDFTGSHDPQTTDPQAIINAILPLRQGHPVHSHAQDFTHVLNCAISHISEGTRSIISHIPYPASLSISPAQIAKDQAHDSTTSRIIKSLLTSNNPPRKFRRYKMIDNYLLARRQKGGTTYRIMLPIYSGLVMMCMSHSGLVGTLATFNAYYDMNRKHHAAELIIASCKGCLPTKTINDPKHEYRNGKLKHGTYPREIIAVDFFKIHSGMSKYCQKIDWVMCIVDSFTCLLYTSPSPRD